METIATYKLMQPIPVLNVRDMKEALEFYCEKLGFGEPWDHEGQYGGVTKDGQHIHFAKSDSPGGSMVYNFVDRVDSVYDVILAGGVEISHPIQDQFYGMRDFTVKDPSGNFIGFAAQISA